MRKSEAAWLRFGLNSPLFPPHNWTIGWFYFANQNKTIGIKLVGQMLKAAAALTAMIATAPALAA